MCTSCGSFLKALLYVYNLNCKCITLCCWLKIIVCYYRQDVIVDVGLVCVEGCAVGSIHILSLPTVYGAVYVYLITRIPVQYGRILHECRDVFSQVRRTSLFNMPFCTHLMRRPFFVGHPYIWSTTVLLDM